MSMEFEKSELGNIYYLSSSNYSQQFQDIKMEKERENLNFQSQNSEKYNLPFTLSELQNSLDKSHDTTAGPDDIHYQILKHLPSDALETLLNIMNEKWRTGKFPEDWHKAVIIPIPKAPCHPGGRNRWLLCACSRWVRSPLYNATVRYTVPSNSLKQYIQKINNTVIISPHIQIQRVK